MCKYIIYIYRERQQTRWDRTVQSHTYMGIGLIQLEKISSYISSARVGGGGVVVIFLYIVGVCVNATIYSCQLFPKFRLSE